MGWQGDSRGDVTIGEQGDIMGWQGDNRGDRLTL